MSHVWKITPWQARDVGIIVDQHVMPAHHARLSGSDFPYVDIEGNFERTRRPLASRDGAEPRQGDQTGPIRADFKHK